jgi:hypothetical protein
LFLFSKWELVFHNRTKQLLKLLICLDDEFWKADGPTAPFEVSMQHLPICCSSRQCGHVASAVIAAQALLLLCLGVKCEAMNPVEC